VPQVPEMLTAAGDVIPLQLLAYHAAVPAAVATSTSRATWRKSGDVE